MALTLQESQSRFHLPSSIRLLTTPGVRGHTLIFTYIMALLFATAHAGRLLGVGQAWTVIFAVGASTVGTYLLFSLLALSEKTRRILFYSRMKTRTELPARRATERGTRSGRERPQEEQQSIEQNSEESEGPEY